MTSIATASKLNDPDRIFLSPRCCEAPNEGRLWCEDDVWSGECEDGNSGIEYVRADLAAQSLSNSGAENLVSMLVQAAREREAAARLPDCIPGAEERLNEARAAVVAAMTPHGAHRLPIQEIARPFEERYGEIGAPWESIVQAIAEAVCAVLASPSTGSDELVSLAASAMQNVELSDGEGNTYRLFDLLDFSGENKAVMITRQLAEAALNAIATPDTDRVAVLERALVQAKARMGLTCSLLLNGQESFDGAAAKRLCDAADEITAALSQPLGSQGGEK